jgi:hypothetical protein
MKKYYVDGQQITEAEAQAIVEKNNEIFARCCASGKITLDMPNIKFITMIEN